MSGHATTKRLTDLTRLLGQLGALYEELFGLIARKIDAMRRADIQAMRECGDQEQLLTQRIRERDGLRCQLMDGVGEQLGLPPRTARSTRLSQLALRMPDSDRTVVMNAAGRLRSVVTRVAQANRIAGAASRELLNHLHWVFAAVKPRDGQPSAYSGAGAMVAASGTYFVDAVG